MPAPSNRAPLAVAALGLTAAAFWAAQGHAALPPQYGRWHEFAAVLGDSSIPNKLRDLTDRIERVGEGSYRVYGGKCFVPVSLSKRAQVGPKGETVIGGSIISVAAVGELRCE